MRKLHLQVIIGSIRAALALIFCVEHAGRIARDFRLSGYLPTGASSGYCAPLAVGARVSGRCGRVALEAAALEAPWSEILIGTAAVLQLFGLLFRHPSEGTTPRDVQLAEGRSKRAFASQRRHATPLTGCFVFLPMVPLRSLSATARGPVSIRDEGNFQETYRSTVVRVEAVA